AGPGIPGSVTIANPNSPTSQVTLNGPAFNYGVYTFRWAVGSGSCGGDTEDVTVTFNQAPSVTLANDIPNVCLNSTGTSIPLTGTFGGGATTGAWSIVGGSGTGVISGETVAGNTVTANYD